MALVVDIDKYLEVLEMEGTGKADSMYCFEAYG